MSMLLLEGIADFEGDYLTHLHPYVREEFVWTRCLDKDGNWLEERERILLKDLTDDHLEALVEWTKDGYPTYINQMMREEVLYRLYL